MTLEKGVADVSVLEDTALDMTAAQNIRLALVQEVARAEGFMPEPGQLIDAMDPVAKWIINGEVPAK